MSQKNCYKELGVEKFEFVATLDSSTSDICRQMDGKVFDMKDYAIGVNVPPLHCFCRSCTVPYYEDDFGSVGERAARGDDGKTYHVPGNMKYEEWKKSFIDGDKSELKEFKKDDKMSLKNKISEQDKKIDELKKQFSDTAEGYSYHEWFSEYSSIEEGYGGADSNDKTFIKLKTLDEEIRNAEKQRVDLLLKKETRDQLDTGFTGRIPDDILPRKGIIESWSSSKETAIAYSGISDYERSSVILECINNRTGVGVQHLSAHGSVEAEVLSCAKYEVVEIVIENKYEYLSKHKDYLYLEQDLISDEMSMKGNIVCKISVKETW